MFSCPGRSAARSDALQNRDLSNFGGWNGPGSAVHHFVLHRVRGKKVVSTNPTE